MKQILAIITIIIFGVSVYAAPYEEVTYTELATTTTAPSAAPAQLATTTMDASPAYATGRDITPPQDMADPNATPLDSPWPLLLFAAAYATYGALRLRRRKRSE